LKTNESVVSSFCFWVVFVSLLLHLYVYFASLWLIPHPIVAISNLRIHGMCVCVCVQTRSVVMLLLWKMRPRWPVISWCKSFYLACRDRI
jgi:hypothetical protein